MNTLKLEFKSNIRSFAVWLGVVSLLLILFMSFFPSMQTESMQKLVGMKLDGIDPVLLKMFGLNDMPDFTDISQYFCYVAQYLNLATAIYACLLGTTSLIKEESDGTIEFLYAQPVTRSSIVKNKMLANLLLYVSFTLIQWILSFILFSAFNGGSKEIVDMLSDLSLIYTGILIAGIVFMGIGFFISTLISHQKQAAPVALGLVFGTFLLGVFSSVVSNLEFLRFISPLNSVAPSGLIKSGFNMPEIICNVSVFIVCVILAFLFYQKKDLKI